MGTNTNHATIKKEFKIAVFMAQQTLDPIKKFTDFTPTPSPMS